MNSINSLLSDIEDNMKFSHVCSTVSSKIDDNISLFSMIGKSVDLMKKNLTTIIFKAK
jgi:hypothetical protein